MGSLMYLLWEAARVGYAYLGRRRRTNVDASSRATQSSSLRTRFLDCDDDVRAPHVSERCAQPDYVLLLLFFFF